MPRRNLDGGWGVSHVFTLRLGLRDLSALEVLRAARGGTDSAILRAVLNEAAERLRAQRREAESNS